MHTSSNPLPTKHSTYPLATPNQNMSTKMGGLGLNTPRDKAIPASILATKGTLNTIYNGVFLGPKRTRFMLPDSITSLYANRETNPSTTF